MTPLEQKFQGGGWGVGIDIFWNHTICTCRVAKISLIRNRHSTFKCNLTCAIFFALNFLLALRQDQISLKKFNCL